MNAELNWKALGAAFSLCAFEVVGAFSTHSRAEAAEPVLPNGTPSASFVAKLKQVFVRGDLESDLQLCKRFSLSCQPAEKYPIKSDQQYSASEERSAIGSVELGYEVANFQTQYLKSGAVGHRRFQIILLPEKLCVRKTDVDSYFDTVLLPEPFAHPGTDVVYTFTKQNIKKRLTLDVRFISRAGCASFVTVNQEVEQ